MSNISKCENCGCEKIDVIHKYKGFYVCPKCGRDTERLYEIERDAEIRNKVIDEFVRRLKNHPYAQYHLDSYLKESISEVAEQMKAGGIDG